MWLQGFAGASKPAASPVAFPAMGATPMAATLVLPLGEGEHSQVLRKPAPITATDICQADTEPPAGDAEDAALPRRTLRQSVAQKGPSEPEMPRAAEAESVPPAGEPETVLPDAEHQKPVVAAQAPRRTRRQTMAAGVLAHVAAPARSAAAPAPRSKAAKRGQRETQKAATLELAAELMTTGESAAEEAMPMIAEEAAEAEIPSQPAGQAAESAQQPEELPVIAEQRSDAHSDRSGRDSIAPMPARKTRRQTLALEMAQGSNGPDLVGKARQKQPGRPGSARAAAPQLLRISEGEPERASTQAAEPASISASHDEETAAAATTATVCSGDVQHDPLTDLQMEIDPQMEPACLVEDTMQPAATIVRRTRRQTMAALARPAGLGHSLLSAGAGWPRGGEARPPALSPLPEEAAPQLPAAAPAAFAAPAAAPDAPAAAVLDTSSRQGDAQPLPGRSTRRQTMALNAPLAAAAGDKGCQPSGASADAGIARGRKRKSAAVAEVPAKEQSRSPELLDDRNANAASVMQPAAEAAATANTEVREELQEALPPKQGRGNKRRKTEEKKVAAKPPRPGSASDKENAPAARGRPQSGRR